MDPHKLLKEAAEIIGERGQDYGGIEDNFANIAKIYSSISGIDIKAHDIALMMVCVKLARIKQSPRKKDNYVDLINYAAFACELLEAE
jgi:hypothetical protein